MEHEKWQLEVAKKKLEVEYVGLSMRMTMPQDDHQTLQQKDRDGEERMGNINTEVGQCKDDFTKACTTKVSNLYAAQW